MPSIYRELAKKIQDEVPIKEVISERIHGAKHDLLCPFHDDKAPGSFHYSNSKNIFKCFSCNEGGGPVKFVQKYDKISRKEAILRLSLQYGFIDKQHYESLSNAPEFSVDEVKAASRKKTDLLEKNPELQLHLVYSQLSKLLPLNESDREYLRSRNITDEDIKRNHYFSFNGEDVSKDICRVLKSADIDENILLGVPGFYKENDEIKMVQVKGIGIPLKNCFNEKIAIQIRSREDNGPRYFYFSSSDKTNGTSCGSVIDVVSKGVVDNTRVYITEGHFKADKLARETGSFVLSLQGVNAISPLGSTLDQFDKYHYPIDEITIAFDSDMFSNTQVLKAAETLCESINELRPDIPVSFLVWDKECGKGIDDVIDNGSFNECSILPQDDFFEMIREHP